MDNKNLKRQFKELLPDQVAPVNLAQGVFRSIRIVNLLLALGELYFLIPLNLAKQFLNPNIKRQLNQIR